MFCEFFPYLLLSPPTSSDCGPHVHQLLEALLAEAALRDHRRVVPRQWEDAAPRGVLQANVVPKPDAAAPRRNFGAHDTQSFPGSSDT